MNPEFLIPIIALLAVFGMPVAIVWVVKSFRLKEKELQLEANLDGDERTKALEARIAQLESSLASLDDRVTRALPSGGPPPKQLPPHD